MTAWGVLYWSPVFYHAGMRLLRRGHEREDMLRSVAREVGSRSVLDLCCGPADLRRWLAGNAYQGIDKNPAFIRPLLRDGAHVKQGDILTADWPAADCLVLVDSFYHFLFRTELLWDRIKSFPCRRVIISEPVENILSRLPPKLAAAASWLVHVDGERHLQRYTNSLFRDVLSSFGFQKVFQAGRNCIGVLDKA